MVAITKYWNGASWAKVKSLKRWDGSAWTHKQGSRYWNGSQWVAIETRQPAKLNDNTHTTRALWHFDENTGNTIYDSSGNNLNINRVQYAEQPTWTGGYYYNGLYFNNDRINAPDNGSLYDFTNSDSWQIDVIFKLAGSVTGDNKVFIGYYGGGSNVIWCGTEESTGKLQVFVRDSAGHEDELLGTTNAYNNTWTKASFVRSGGNLYVYKNGVLQNSKNDNNTSGYNIPRFNIGWFSASFPLYALDTCYIDEIRIMKGVYVTVL